jgi:glycosyltransferase involved in cell wall biosynthesis
MPTYLNACDVLLLTSKHEGSPTVTKEALACNLPIVSVDVGDMRRQIGSIEGCVLCEDDSPQVIASGVSSVLRSRKRVEGRKSVAQLDERLMVEKITSIYQSIFHDG